MTKNLEVVIVGAGMSGLLMGIKLQEAGVPFTIYEKAAEVGGTWRDNRYPGLFCDVPSRYYSYSFAPNPDWSRWYSPGNEIQYYFERIAADYSLRHRIRFGEEVTSARRVGGRWQVSTAGGEEVSADVLILATGILHHPKMPDIPGRDSFAGAAFHSARWDSDVVLEGKRIGVIGNGSTGVQLTAELPDIAGRLTLFQRTPQWVLPLPNPRYSRVTRWVMRRSKALNRLAYRGWQKALETMFAGLTHPGWQQSLLAGLCRWHLRTVRDPELRRKLTPDYQAGCKRLAMSWRFYKAVQLPNVEVVTEPIDQIEPAGIRTSDGKLHELDVIVFATGFDAHAYMRPMELISEDGMSIDDLWRERVSSYRTVALPSFPNVFTLGGPFSPINNQSVIKVSETQADYVMQLIRLLRDGEVSALVPTEKATTQFMESMREAVPGTVWAGGCHSWYEDRDGTLTVWPWVAQRHREMLRTPDLEDFEVEYQK